MGGAKLTRNTHVKFLGIFVDGKLNCYEHIKLCKQNNISCPLCSKKLQKVYECRCSKNLHYSLTCQYLSNGIHLWGSSYKTFLEQLIVLQQKAARIVCILPLSKLHECCLGKFMYHQHNNLEPVQIMRDIVLKYKTKQVTVRDNCGRSQHLVIVFYHFFFFFFFVFLLIFFSSLSFFCNCSFLISSCCFQFEGLILSFCRLPQGTLSVI